MGILASSRKTTLMSSPSKPRTRLTPTRSSKCTPALQQSTLTRSSKRSHTEIPGPLAKQRFTHLDFHQIEVSTCGSLFGSRIKSYQQGYPSVKGQFVTCW